jgi:hypothetical protein
MKKVLVTLLLCLGLLVAVESTGLAEGRPIWPTSTFSSTVSSTRGTSQ